MKQWDLIRPADAGGGEALLFIQEEAGWLGRWLGRPGRRRLFRGSGTVWREIRRPGIVPWRCSRAEEQRLYEFWVHCRETGRLE